MTAYRTRWKKVKTIAIGLALASCGRVEDPKDYGDISGVEELAQPLSALASAPTFSAGALSIVMAAGEIAVISKHAVSGAILVNDVATGANATSLKTISITGSSGVDTVILDFANGTFAPGTASGPGIVAALGAGADVFKLRGMGAAVDTLTVGGTALATDMAFNVDLNKDISVSGTGTIAYTFSLGGGNDIYNANSGAYGTGGVAFTGDAIVYGGLGDDSLTGGDGDDTFYGDLGNDTMNGGMSVTDSDVYNGGGGTGDIVTYAARTLAVDVTVGAGADDGDTASGETDDIKSDVEIVYGGSAGDTFTGTTGNQTFYGGPGNDTFLMGLLASTGAGDDTVYGEAGIDTVSYAARLEAVTVSMDLNVANDGNPGVPELDNIRSDVENVICPTGAFVCTVTGNALDNTITGGAGADVLAGGAGDDTFVMGANAGIGAGADSIAGGAGIDTVNFASFGAVIDVILDGTASATMSKVIGNDVENVTCPTASACTVTGNGLNNRIVGSSAVDTINALGGDDFVETSGANDIIDCGDGSDIVTGAGSPVKTDCEL
ncbi:MAG: calcium-binding protein [Myxococcaceae bacterium]|nr:calcium-binding protein [Myxococcaceae bacterium]